MKTKDNFPARPALAALAAILAAAAQAQPSIDQSSVGLSQDPGTKLVTVSYVLDGDPAVVTVDFQTNCVASGEWTTIGAEKFARVAGDMNCLVTNVNRTCTITWQPSDADAWPNGYVAGGSMRAVVKAWATNHPPPYMIVDMRYVPGKKWYYASAEAVPYGITNDLYKTSRLAFRLVPAAQVTYRMGAPSGEPGQPVAKRETQHLVSFTNDFYLSVYPVTQQQHAYHTVASSKTPSIVTNNLPATATYPVENINWSDLRGWYTDSSIKVGHWPLHGHELSYKSVITNLRALVKIPSLDLPTDAQWEYACRAGTSTSTYAGDVTSASGTDPVVDEIAWYTKNSGGVTHPVGLKKPNPWGFYDMLGNVWEECLDQYDTSSGADGAVPSADATDPPGVNLDTLTTLNTSWMRVKRGGAYNASAGSCRSAIRSSAGCRSAEAATGYRLACDAMALQ